MNGSSSEAAEAERANFAERAAEEGKTGNSVLLDRNAVTYLKGIGKFRVRNKEEFIF